MSSARVAVVSSTVRRFRCSTLALSLAALVVLALAPLGSAASAASAPSTLCAGYQGCRLGTFTTHGYQNVSDRSYWTMYAGDNCTNYVAYVESSTYAVPAPTYDLGNGGQWASAAAAHGVTVNHVPSVGAVAVWTGGASGMSSSGHVAVVEAVGPRNSYVVVSQQHMIVADGYDWVRIMRTSTANEWENWPTAFIHFPSPVVTTLEDAVSHVRRAPLP
jgi:surface antigen